jgi:hypothetical protein
MMQKAINIARQLSWFRDKAFMLYMNANVMPFPIRTAASGASMVSGAMAHYDTELTKRNGALAQ